MKDMVADVNAKGIDKFTALHFAADGGHLLII
jgi:ankyrin repeat protein